MKKRILSMIITLALVFGCGAMQAFAADAKVTASLPADKKTVSSGYAAFQASSMFGKVYPISKYHVKFQAVGTNNTGITGKPVADMNVAVSCNYTKAINANYNMYKIVISGWDVDHAVKGCVGYGYLE